MLPSQVFTWESLYTDPDFNHVKVEDYGFSDISEGDNDTLEAVEDWYAYGDHNLMVAHLGELTMLDTSMELNQKIMQIGCYCWTINCSLLSIIFRKAGHYDNSRPWDE